MEDPQLTILVVVDSSKGSQYGSQVAAPVAGMFFKNALSYLEISPILTSEQEIATSKKTVYVPDVVGMKYKDAIKELEKNKLNYEVSPAFEGLEEDFTMVDQFPAAGSQATKKDIVFIYRE